MDKTLDNLREMLATFSISGRYRAWHPDRPAALAHAHTLAELCDSVPGLPQMAVRLEQSQAGGFTVTLVGSNINVYEQGNDKTDSATPREDS